MDLENRELEELLEEYVSSSDSNIIFDICELLFDSYVIYPTNVKLNGNDVEEETIVGSDDDLVQYELSYVTIEGLNFLPVFTSEEKILDQGISDKKRCLFPFRMFVESFVKTVDMEIEGIIVNPNKDNFLLPKEIIDSVIYVLDHQNKELVS